MPLPLPLPLPPAMMPPPQQPKKPTVPTRPTPMLPLMSRGVDADVATPMPPGYASVEGRAGGRGLSAPASNFELPLG